MSQIWWYKKVELFIKKLYTGARKSSTKLLYKQFHQRFTNLSGDIRRGYEENLNGEVWICTRWQVFIYNMKYFSNHCSSPENCLLPIFSNEKFQCMRKESPKIVESPSVGNIEIVWCPPRIDLRDAKWYATLPFGFASIPLPLRHSTDVILFVCCCYYYFCSLFVCVIDDLNEKIIQLISNVKRSVNRCNTIHTI